MSENNKWKRYKYLDPVVTMESAFYEFSFTQQLQFRNYKIQCYTIINKKIGRFVGEGYYVKGTRTYFVAVNGYDVSTENRMGEDSLYGYPNEYSQLHDIWMVFFLVDRMGNKYPLTYLPGTEPSTFDGFSFSTSTTYVDLSHKVIVNPVKPRTRKVSTIKNESGIF